MSVLAAGATCALAQDGRIHRCIGENGEPTFGDRKCEAGTAAPAPADARIPAWASPLPLAGEPFVTQTCPRTPDDLRDRVAAAFAAKNGVGLSGLFLWEGFSHGAAVAPLRELATLINEPLISMEIESFGRYPDRDRRFGRREQDDDAALLELVIRTVQMQERQVPHEAISRFEVTGSGGCWWLLLPW